MNGSSRIDACERLVEECGFREQLLVVRNEPGVRAVGKEMFGDGDMAAAVIDRIVHHGRTSGSIASRTTTVMFW